MRKLLNLSGYIEAGAGAAVAAFPSATVKLLLGPPHESPAAAALGRLAGAAPVALSVACWRGGFNAQSCAARGVVTAMVINNFGAVLILDAVGLASRPVRIALWPAILIHVVRTRWTIASLLGKLPGSTRQEPKP